MDNADETDADLALTRTASRASPALTAGSEADSDENPMSPSPPNALMGKQRQAIATTAYYESREASMSHVEFLEEEGVYLPSRPRRAIIAAY